MIQNWCLSEQLMELNIDMESLELAEESENVNGLKDSEKARRSLRRSSRLRNKINFTVEDSSMQNKKPKRSTTIEEYYLSKKVKRLPSMLETIYEEPKSSNNEFQYMSVKKFKRVLTFEEDNTTLKKNKRSKKRLMKAKKVTAAHRISSKRKISMEVLLRKLETIEEDSDRYLQQQDILPIQDNNFS